MLRRPFTKNIENAKGTFRPLTIFPSTFPSTDSIASRMSGGRSPSRRGGSPGRRGGSPGRRGGSPGRRGGSPSRRGGSPGRRDRSPGRRGGSPGRRGRELPAIKEEERKDRSSAECCEYGFDCGFGQDCFKSHGHMPVCDAEEGPGKTCTDRACPLCHANDCGGHQALQEKRRKAAEARRAKDLQRQAQKLVRRGLDPDALADAMRATTLSD